MLFLCLLSEQKETQFIYEVRPLTLPLKNAESQDTFEDVKKQEEREVINANVEKAVRMIDQNKVADANNFSSYPMENHFSNIKGIFLKSQIQTVF